MNTPDEIISELRNAANIVITAHIRPDGDAVGAALGLRRILADAGKTAIIVDLSPIPERYHFLPQPQECLTADSIHFTDVDLIVVLDSGSLDRSPAFIQRHNAKITVINIDHHISNTHFGKLNFVDPNASSVGEIICRLAQTAAMKISRPAAEALWVSIITDTGRFSYSNTTPATMQAAAVLLQTGISPAHINHTVYNSRPLKQVKLQGRAIENLSLHENGRLALTKLSADDFTALECTPADTEEIVNIARDIKGVAVAVFIYDIPEKNETKISLRTDEPYDAAELCRSLGGGGHARAAGCALPGNVTENSDKILNLLHNQWFQQ